MNNKYKLLERLMKEMDWEEKEESIFDLDSIILNTL